ncbi:hypothetical protein VIBR0546_01456, partial [Vibrio brasiliensis LMG 20546]
LKCKAKLRSFIFVLWGFNLKLRYFLTNLDIQNHLLVLFSAIKATARFYWGVSLVKM